ncbi:MAG: hypothetical protein ACTHLR_02735 [Rhizomicrobium sp.]
MSEPDIPTRRPGHWLEYISTVVAVIISVSSLWVAIGSEKANRQMVAASSWPILIVGSGNVGDNGQAEIIFRITNAGVGPAKVRTFELFYKGKPYPSSSALMRACCDPHFQDMTSPEQMQIAQWAFITGEVPGNVIRAGESQVFIRYGLHSEHANAWHALDAARQRDISYRVCYCSVFDECWRNTITNKDRLDPVRVDTCPVPAVPYKE